MTKRANLEDAETVLGDREFDTIVVGGGASGLVAAIVSAREGRSVLIVEKLPRLGVKLLATGGGRCNLSNTLDVESFISSFGKDGRFMQYAIEEFGYRELVEFFSSIGVETHIPDGFRIFPTDHKATTVVKALLAEISKLDIAVECSYRVEHIITDQNSAIGVESKEQRYYAKNIILSTGGRGYSKLGGGTDGYTLASELGHRIVETYPAMMPLKVEESWIANCRADTIGGAEIVVDIKKYKRLRAKGDLIFTKNGIRGPVVLDFSREITPLFDKMDSVPILINMTKGMNEEQILSHLKRYNEKSPTQTIITLLQTLLPYSIAIELCKLSDIDTDTSLTKQKGSSRAELISLLAWTSLTITGHDGFEMAMVTRGGVHLGEIDPKTMQSKIVPNLYLCGELLNIDGPCGGYNLQWAFSSGYLAGRVLGE